MKSKLQEQDHEESCFSGQHEQPKKVTPTPNNHILTFKFPEITIRYLSPLYYPEFRSPDINIIQNIDDKREYPIYGLKISIDRLKLSVQHRRFSAVDFFTVLAQHGFTLEDGQPIFGSCYSTRGGFKANSSSGCLLYNTDPFNGVPKYLPDAMIIIDDLDDKIIRAMDVILSKLGYEVKVSSIEIAFDFYTQYTAEIDFFLQHHLYLFNQSNQPTKDGKIRGAFAFETTKYTNSERTSTKGMKIYPKEDEVTKEPFIRLELTIKRGILKNKALPFPFTSLKTLNLPKIFGFRTLDCEALMKTLKNRRKDDIALMNEKKPNSNIGSLLESDIRNTILLLFNDPEALIIGEKGDKIDTICMLMKKVQALKKQGDYAAMLRSYNRFLKPVEDFENQFWSIVNSHPLFK